jgi:hypothetical protein
MRRSSTEQFGCRAKAMTHKNLGGWHQRWRTVPAVGPAGAPHRKGSKKRACCGARRIRKRLRFPAPLSIPQLRKLPKSPQAAQRWDGRPGEARQGQPITNLPWPTVLPPAFHCSPLGGSHHSSMSRPLIRRAFRVLPCTKASSAKSSRRRSQPLTSIRSTK